MNTHMVKAGHEVKSMNTPNTDAIFVPDVDITEDRHNVILRADIPGVEQKAMDITVENNVLTIVGVMSVEAPADAQLVGQEYGVGKFRRSFTLSNAVDVGGVKAKVQHGVLTVTLPKREEVKTRKIEISN